VAWFTDLLYISTAKIIHTGISIWASWLLDSTQTPRPGLKIKCDVSQARTENKLFGHQQNTVNTVYDSVSPRHSVDDWAIDVDSHNRLSSPYINCLGLKQILCINLDVKLPIFNEGVQGEGANQPDGEHARGQTRQGANQPNTGANQPGTPPRSSPRTELFIMSTTNIPIINKIETR